MGRITPVRRGMPGIDVGVALCLFVTMLRTASAAEPEALADEPLGRHVAHAHEASLETVLEKRFLRVVTSSSSFDYSIHQGRRAGYQYEMVRAFTEHLNAKYRKNRQDLPIQFELLPVPSDRMIAMLRDGYADMIAARLTVTPEREGSLLFSRPYRRVRELIVAHVDAPRITDRASLAGKTVAVRRSSSYHDSLVAVSRALRSEGRDPVEIVSVDPRLETENILALVAERRFDYTVADSMVARSAASFHPELRVVEDVPLREEGRLAWASIPDADDLVAEMDVFLRRYRHGSLLGNVAVQRYFRDQGRLRQQLSDGTAAGLSRYDDVFRRFGGEYGFDWRLVAAVAYQESRFDQRARNRWGATGLFQIKPATAREPYVAIEPIAGEKNAANNVHAGVKYLAWIKSRYFDDVEGMRERDRIRMTLAAYNAGPRTVLEARRRARRMGLDPERWFRHVELALLSMNESEPVKYVSEINSRYLSYRMLGVE